MPQNKCSIERKRSRNKTGATCRAAAPPTRASELWMRPHAGRVLKPSTPASSAARNEAPPGDRYPSLHERKDNLARPQTLELPITVQKVLEGASHLSVLLRQLAWHRFQEFVSLSCQWSGRRRASTDMGDAATRGLYRRAAREERRDAVAPSLPPEDELPVSPKLRGKLR